MSRSSHTVEVSTKDDLQGSVSEYSIDASHATRKLKGSAISGGVIATTSQSLQFGLNLLSIAVLARLLTPQDFGLVAMVLTVTSFLRIFKDVGLSTVTVQRETITNAQVSNLFWINLAVGGLGSLIVCAATPVIAWFYREPRLLRIAPALAVTFLFAGASVQHIALLTRQLRFKAIAFIEVTSLVAGISVGIGLAWLQFGPWALVGFQVSMPLVYLLLSWSVCSWRPQVPAKGTGVRPLLGFGANLTASTFMASLARGADSLLLGRFYGPDAVGLYSRGSALFLRPLEQFMAPINAVVLPVLSRLQTKPDRYRRTFLQVYEALALVSFLGTGLSLPLARPLTLVVLGAKWAGAAGIFASLTLATLFVPVTASATWLFSTQGRGQTLLRCTSILSCLMVGAFLSGLPFGPVGVALAYSLSGLFVIMPILYSIAGRSGPVSTKDLWVSFLRLVPVWIVACVVTWFMHSLVSNRAPLIQLLVCTPTGLLAGVFFIWLYAPSRATTVNVIRALMEWKKSL